MSTSSAKWSDPRAATPAVQGICDQVLPAVQADMGRTFDQFIAYQYREQFVTSTNYLIRVSIGEMSYIDIEVTQIPSEQPILNGIQEAQGQNSPLEPFPPFLPDQQ